MLSFGLSVPELKGEIQKELDNDIAAINGSNTAKDYRKVLGDNPDDITKTNYGNNNVMGPDKEEILHGTHVAGIIAEAQQPKDVTTDKAE